MADARKGILVPRLAHDDVRAPAADTRARAGEDHYLVLIGRDEAALARVTTGAEAATAFQGETWLRNWYATIGPTVGEPLLLSVIDRHSGALALALPLVRRRRGRLRVIEFSDDDVSDANAPLL